MAVTFVLAGSVVICLTLERFGDEVGGFDGGRGVGSDVGKAAGDGLRDFGSNGDVGSLKRKDKIRNKKNNLTLAFRGHSGWSLNFTECYSLLYDKTL